MNRAIRAESIALQTMPRRKVDSLNVTYRDDKFLRPAVILH